MGGENVMDDVFHLYGRGEKRDECEKSKRIKIVHIGGKARQGKARQEVWVRVR